MTAMDKGVFEAARVIRPYLKDLVGPAAEQLDNRIADLLGAADRGQDVTAELHLLLDGDEATSSFLGAVLADAPHYRPPTMQEDQLRRDGVYNYNPLAGDVGPVLHAGKYSCPQGDYVWYRAAVGAAIPPCPTHGPGLIRT
jgi:hypothetical protein